MNRPLTITPETARDLAKKYGIKWDSYERSHARQSMAVLKTLHNRLLAKEAEDAARAEELQVHRFFVWQEAQNRHLTGKPCGDFLQAIETGYPVKVKVSGLASQYRRFAGVALS